MFTGIANNLNRSFLRARRVAIAFLLAACLLLTRSTIASAQALADRVPDDALIYVGWNGTDKLSPAFADSRFKAFLDQSNLREAVSQALPQLIDKITEQNPDAAAPLQALSTLAPIIWTHPTAFYFGGLDMKGNPPMAKVAILVDAGKDAPALLTQVQGLIAQAHLPPIVPIEATNYNGLVAITIDRTPEFDALLGAPGGAKAALPLSQRKDFQDDLAQLTKSPVLTAYLDVAGLVALGDAVSGFSERGQENWPKFVDLAGLKKVRSAAFTAGFDDKDWSVQALVTPTAGSTFPDQTPISDDILKTIPADATIASCKQFSLAAFYDRIHDAVAAGDARGQANFDRGLQQLNALLGLDLRKDLLQSLGADWTGYSSPTVGGNGLLGMVIVNHLTDPAKAEESLSKVEAAIDTAINQNEGRKIHIAFRQTTVGGVTIHYLAVPLISPAWAIKDGNLYVALYPQIVASAMQQPAAATSILDNPDFQALRKRLGGEKASNIVFYDLPKTAPNSYGSLLLLSQLVNGGANLFGIQTPAIIIPQLDALMKDLIPAGAVTSTDASGWHFKSVSPFPGSTVLAGVANPMIIAGVAGVATAVTLPTLHRAREMSERVKDEANLRSIGQYCMLYANENKDALPTSLGELLVSESAPVGVFVSPLAKTPIPQSIFNGTPKEKAGWIDANSSYVYLGAGKTMNSPADTVLAYEKFSDPRGTDVLFVDGHVDWMPTMQAHDLIDKQTKKQAP